MRIRKRLELAAFLSVVGGLTGVWAAPAARAEGVEIAVTAPQGHPGAAVTHATLTRDGAPVGEFSGFLFVSGGTSRIDVPVSEPPNGLELLYVSPFGSPAATPTTYSVAPAQFGFGTAYFLVPVPSPGGAVGATTAGDPASDASFAVTSVPPSEDGEAPTCEPATTERGRLDQRVEDAGSGLAGIEVVTGANVAVTVPPFAVGTTDPVTVTAVIEDESHSATLLLRVSDVAGNVRWCKRLQKRHGHTRWRSFHYGW